MPEDANPYREAIDDLLEDEQRKQLQELEQELNLYIAETDAANDRANDLIRRKHFDRPFEHLEAELVAEYATQVRYFQRRFVKKLKALLEEWKDTPEEE